LTLVLAVPILRVVFRRIQDAEDARLPESDTSN